MNVRFTDGHSANDWRHVQLSSDFDLSEFKSVVEKLYGPMENFRFMIQFKELKVDDAEKFKVQRNLIINHCIIYVAKRMMS